MGSERATPRPWMVPTYAPFQVLQMSALLGDAAIAVAYEDERRGRSKAERDANARLIVSAVNSHDANQKLLEAARNLRDVYRRAQAYPLDVNEEEWRDAEDDLDEAIARVEESQDGS